MTGGRASTRAARSSRSSSHARDHSRAWRGADRSQHWRDRLSWRMRPRLALAVGIAGMAAGVTLGWALFRPRTPLVIRPAPGGEGESGANERQDAERAARR